METQKKLSYPEPKVEEKNLFYANLLLNDYASNVSEDTAIHLYLYQYLSHFQKNKEIANALLEISKQEMEHFKLLGETIYLLGMEPHYAAIDSETQTAIYWNAENVNYETDIKKILEYNIHAEEEAIKKYELHLSLIHDKYIQALIQRIIIDEKEHILIFKKLQNEIK